MEDEHIAVVTKILGNGLFKVKHQDTTSIAHLRGSMKGNKKKIVSLQSVLLVSLRPWDHSHSDILHVYSTNHVAALSQNGILEQNNA
jgi:initiation factor 1A